MKWKVIKWQFEMGDEQGTRLRQADMQITVEKRKKEQHFKDICYGCTKLLNLQDTCLIGSKRNHVSTIDRQGFNGKSEQLQPQQIM